MKNRPKRVVLITGGSSGVGLALAKQMVNQQSTVIICSRSQEKLNQAKKQIPQLVTLQCDITKPNDRQVLTEIIFPRGFSLPKYFSADFSVMITVFGSLRTMCGSPLINVKSKTSKSDLST